MKTIITLLLLFKIAFSQTIIPAPLPEAFLNTISSRAFPEAFPRSPALRGRIVGGEKVPIEDRPFQGYMIIDNTYFCGCELLCLKGFDMQVVLTAGHCGIIGSTFEIVFGSSYALADETDPHVVIQTVTSKNVFVHPEYNDENLNNDIAVIVLNKPIRRTKFINCIHPALDESYFKQGRKIIVSGYGMFSDYYRAISPYLKQVCISIFPYNGCRFVWGDEIITENTMCINTSGGQAPCFGDSGGPITTVPKTYKKGGKSEPLLIGVVSFGAEFCEENIPDGIVRVKGFLPWIRETVEECLL